MAERGFNRSHVAVGHPDFIRQRTERLLGLFERRQCSDAEPFVLGLQLLKHLEAGLLFRLFLQRSIQLLRQLIRLLLNFVQALLSFLERIAPCLNALFFRFDVRCESAQPLFQSRALLFELGLLCGELFQTDNIALLLQIKHVDFVADACELLSRGEDIRLRLAQRSLLLDQIVLDGLPGLPFGLQRLAMLFKRAGRSGPLPGHRGQFLLRCQTSFLRL